jgi:hypothetical protein
VSTGLISPQQFRTPQKAGAGTMLMGMEAKSSEAYHSAFVNLSVYISKVITTLSPCKEYQ